MKYWEQGEEKNVIFLLHPPQLPLIISLPYFLWASYSRTGQNPDPIQRRTFVHCFLQMRVGGGGWNTGAEEAGILVVPHSVGLVARLHERIQALLLRHIPTRHIAIAADCQHGLLDHRGIFRKCDAHDWDIFGGLLRPDTNLLA